MLGKTPRRPEEIGGYIPNIDDQASVSTLGTPGGAVRETIINYIEEEGVKCKG